MSRLRPWLSMWTAPQKTVRKLIETNPNYGIFWLSAAYMLQLVFYCLNFWSVGFKVSHYALIFPSLLLSPILGFVWLLFYGWILHFTGSWFGGKAPTTHLRTALVWSKLPMTLSLLIWLPLWIYDPNGVFIQHGSGPESFFIHGSLLFLKGWSWILFISALREVQGFSWLRSIANTLVACIIYTAAFLSFLILFKILSRLISFTS